MMDVVDVLRKHEAAKQEALRKEPVKELCGEGCIVCALYALALEAQNTKQQAVNPARMRELVPGESVSYALDICLDAWL